ncbi:long-chain fatty acid-CoA ligase [Ophidiomyces ophidiicola]|nr:long-chain fatty acid-CoA ligase [Ophidiomyces ophidiicola]KAI1985603.1 long-chain fatty acid-CoA ligase [Ophidiomyces ophidiicola]KAI1988752.1 long-chain fatty acid-CoA ligase [Ophidiomyces ophidiicola]KAI2003197.1 long-chain fatty acid-CoA ligase [Ophidiomyces ophidiicola]
MSKKDAVLYPRISKRGPFTIEAPGYEPVKGETIPRRHPTAKDGLKRSPDPEIATLYDNLRWSAKKYGNKKAVGSRKLIKTHVETRKVKKLIDGVEQEVDKDWTYYEYSGYTFMSYTEFETLALQMGAGLRKLGHEKDSRVHLFSATSAHWLSLALGAGSQSITIVTAYDSLGEDGLKHSLLETHSSTIFLDPHLIPVITNVLKDAKDIKHVIYDTSSEVKPEHLEKLKTEFPHVTSMSFEDLRKLGEDNLVEPVPPSRDDLCCIMYTSGSTGPPKGVPLRHRNVVAAMAGADTVVGEHLGPNDTLLTYLPQAHILEFVFENICLFWGGTMGYGSPKTLSDTSMRNCKGDIKELKPTILVGVPMVWESVKKGILGNVNKSSAIIKALFWGGLATKSFLMSTGLPGAGIIDAIVFEKLKEATGGRLRLMLTGGGPISKDTQRFLSMSICPMIGGYGLTETSAMGGLNDPMTWNADAIGEIPASVEIKLVDFLDAGYSTANNPPQGEIWIRGESVAECYFENENETKAAFSDGWFMTGDIGEFDKHGHIKIIDRKKNLVKSLNGEYIALEKLESIYRSAHIVANICIYAAPDQSKPVAIIVPAEPALHQLAKDNGIEGDSIGTLVHNAKLNSIILREMQAAGRAGGLRPFEIIEGVVLSDEEWTPQNGFTTAAQKLQRRKIVSKFQKDIDHAYGKS